MKLYEIEQVYTDFLEAVENGEIPEEAMGDTLEAIQGEFREKADNIACAIKNISAESAALKAEEKALKERRESKDRKVDQLKHYLRQAMETVGFKKLETTRNVVSLRLSTSVYVPDEQQFFAAHPEYCKVEEVIKISKAEIAKALKAGEEISGAELRTNQNLQIK